MKLLIFIHSLSSGGAERVTSSLANYWAEQGWTVTIVTITGRELDFYLLHPQVRRIALELDSNSSSALTALYYNLKRVFGLRRVLLQEKPDVALGMMAAANILLALAAKGTGIPAIGGERIYPPMLPLGRIWDFLRHKSYAHLSAVVAQTETTSQWLRNNVDLPEAVVIPNPVSYPLIAHEPKVSPETRKIQVACRHLLLAVGRLAPQKQFDRLLDAFAELAPQLPDWRLVIVGEGAERPALEKQVLSLGLEDRVQLPGAVGNIGEWYEAADLYVMTSRFEGFPNTLLEALAHGVAAVSTDCETGPREIVRHETDGLLVPRDDPHALVSALARLMTNEPLRHRYAARAVEVRERFSLAHVAGQWEELFAAVQRRKDIEQYDEHAYSLQGVRDQTGTKKHIFLLINTMEGGGAERVAALLCNYWVARRYEVTVMATFSGRGGCVYPLDERIHLEYLADRVSSTRRTFGTMARRFWVLRRAIKESDADVVVSFLSRVNIVTLLASRGLSVPVVVSERIYPPALSLGRVWEMLRRLTYPWAKTVVVQTGDMERWFDKNCPTARTSVIANPVVFPLPVTDDAQKPDQWLDKGRHMVLAAGRLEEQKGFDRLFQAFALLASYYPTWDLVVLGEGKQRKRLEREREMLGMIGRVHLPGWVGNLPDWYHRADLFVMSSWFEGFPNVLVEAMGHNLPSVSFDCDTGPRDIIRSGVDGLLVKMEQGGAGLAAAMASLMGDQFLRVRMGKAAGEVRERFSLERIGSLWDEVFGFVK